MNPLASLKKSIDWKRIKRFLLVLSAASIIVSVIIDNYMMIVNSLLYFAFMIAYLVVEVTIDDWKEKRKYAELQKGNAHLPFKRPINTNSNGATGHTRSRNA